MANRKVEVNYGVWGMVRKAAVTVAVVAMLGGLVIWYIPIIKQTDALQKEIGAKRRQLEKQKELHQRYTDEITALRTDPETVERAVREKLNLVRPEEIIYHFEPTRSER